MYFGRLSKIFSFLSQTKCPWWISLLKHGKLLWQFSRLLYENMNNYIVSYFYWFMLFLLLTRTQEKKRKQSVCTGWCTPFCLVALLSSLSLLRPQFGPTIWIRQKRRIGVCKGKNWRGDPYPHKTQCVLHKRIAHTARTTNFRWKSQFLGLKFLFQQPHNTWFTNN